MSKKRSLFNDKSLKRILNNLFNDNQLSFDFLRWVLIRTYVQILVYAPGEFVSVAKEIFANTPAGVVLEIVDGMDILPKGAEEDL